MYNISLIYKVQIYCVTNCDVISLWSAEILGEVGVQQAILRIELAAKLAEKREAIRIQLFPVFGEHRTRVAEQRCTTPVFGELCEVDNEVLPPFFLCRCYLQGHQRFVE